VPGELITMKRGCEIGKRREARLTFRVEEGDIAE